MHRIPLYKQITILPMNISFWGMTSNTAKNILITSLGAYGEASEGRIVGS